MKCPHCLDAYHSSLQCHSFGKDLNGNWEVAWETCPSCRRFIVTLINKSDTLHDKRFLVHPRSPSRTPVSADVPEAFAQDYKEACCVFTDSPKASAALSRRCLQNVLREKAVVNKSDLSKEIDEVLKSKQLPSHLAEAVDAIRNIGNFASHPIKSTNTGEIVDVEPGEADWLLDILEGLFDFYFVQPAILKKKREALDKKLTEAGKPPLKGG